MHDNLDVINTHDNLDVVNAHDNLDVVNAQADPECIERARCAALSVLHACTRCYKLPLLLCTSCYSFPKMYLLHHMGVKGLGREYKC